MTKGGETMNNDIVAYLLQPAAQIALIIGLAELCKQLGCPTRFIPLIDLGLGLVSGCCVYAVGLGEPWINGIMLGIAMGLSACGLFSGIKNTIEKNNNKGEIDNGKSEP